MLDFLDMPDESSRRKLGGFRLGDFVDIHLRSAAANDLKNMAVRRRHLENAVLVPKNFGRIFDNHRAIKRLIHVLHPSAHICYFFAPVPLNHDYAQTTIRQIVY
jgi:hypothetical protein